MGELAPMTGPTEAELIDRLRRRDTGALEILMERHAARVYRVALGVTRNEADAEEVAQDVFLSLFEKIGAFEERAALGTWLYRVATNRALLRRRGKRVELEVSLEDQLPAFKDDGHRAGHRPAPAALPGGGGSARHRGALQRGDGRDPERAGLVGEITPAPGADGP